VHFTRGYCACLSWEPLLQLRASPPRSLSIAQSRGDPTAQRRTPKGRPPWPRPWSWAACLTRSTRTSFSAYGRRGLVGAVGLGHRSRDPLRCGAIATRFCRRRPSKHRTAWTKCYVIKRDKAFRCAARRGRGGRPSAAHFRCRRLDAARRVMLSHPHLQPVHRVVWPLPDVGAARGRRVQDIPARGFCKGAPCSVRSSRGLATWPRS
jgi:hypothetical protein